VKAPLSSECRCCLGARVALPRHREGPEPARLSRGVLVFGMRTDAPFQPLMRVARTNVA
jgi:hypothetical protein